MVTDPPYGVDYDPGWRKGLDTVKRSLGKVAHDDRADWREVWSLFPGDVAYVWHSGTQSHVVADSLISKGFTIRAQIVWAKPHFAISRGHYHPQHEPCFYAVRKTGHWAGDRKQSTVWQIANGTFQGGATKAEDAKTGHGTQKPVECMKRPIENNSTHGQAVYEPFSGSGTTIIAAEMTGRNCHAIEIDPAYIDVAVKRWQDFTGQKATLEGDGRTFDEIAAERLQRAA
jgi:DNA modification methylase